MRMRRIGLVEDQAMRGSSATVLLAACYACQSYCIITTSRVVIGIIIMLMLMLLIVP